MYSDWAMDSAPPPNVPDTLIPGSSVWRARTAGSGDIGGWVQLGADANAPRTPPSLYSFVYPNGMVDGASPANIWTQLPDFNEVYIGFWWKVSDPWQYHTVGDKLGYLWAGANDMFLIQYGSPPKVAAYVQFTTGEWLYPNVTSTTITRGVWHLVELYAQYIPGQKGRIKWWVDGKLQGDYKSWNTGGIGGPFYQWMFDPVWGGNDGSVKHETDSFSFDDVHISGR